MPTNEFHVTEQAITALANVLDDIAVQAGLEDSHPDPEDIAAGALVALAEDGWELVCHKALHIDEAGTATLKDQEFNVMNHFAQLAKVKGGNDNG
jgi:hypothetical protein